MANYQSNMNGNAGHGQRNHLMTKGVNERLDEILAEAYSHPADRARCIKPAYECPRN